MPTLGQRSHFCSRTWTHCSFKEQLQSMNVSTVASVISSSLLPELNTVVIKTTIREQTQTVVMMERHNVFYT